VIALVVGLIVFLGGGDGTPETPPTSPGQGTTEPPTSPTTSVSPTTTEPSPTDTPVLGTVIFSEDFTTASDVFCQQSDQQARYSFVDGTYRIFVGRKNWSAWCRADSPDLESLSNVAVEVDAGKDSGVTDGNFGVICGHVDNQNFYELTMDSSDGFYRIAEWAAGSQEILTEGFSEAISTGNSSYRIRAECTGGAGGEPVTLALLVDGEPIAETTDDQNPYASGSVGLIAGTFTQPDVETRFDNFSVTQLP
jgi:hypothetical protein